MKLVLVSCFVLFAYAAFAQEYNPVYEYDFTFKQNSKQVLFGDKVNLRSGPTAADEVLSVLRIGSPVHIIKKTDEKIKLRNKDWFWYQVKADGKLGYIPGAFMAMREVELAENRVFISVEHNEYDNLVACIREQTSDTSFNEFKQNIPVSTFGVEVTNGRGVEGVQSILFVDYYAEACGYDGGGAYYFHDGEQLIKACELAEIGDGGIFWFGEELYFPEDKRGEAGVIIYRQEHGEAVEEDPWWTEAKITVRHIKWNGNGFTPSMEEVQKDNEE